MHLTTATPQDLDQIFALFLRAKAKMEQEGNFSWSHDYPEKINFEEDIASGLLYLYKEDGHIVATITASFKPEDDFFYRSKSQKKVARLRQQLGMGEEEPFLLLHRLMVEPNKQGHGLAKAMFQAMADLYPNHMMVFAVYPDNLRARYVYDHDGFSNLGIYLPFEYGPQARCLLYYKPTSPSGKNEITK
jgi:GNAT superfamily N-acetyltransferase